MKVLVTGSRGQLGTAIRRVFANERIIATDRAELDITDREAVLRFVERERPDAIINCAAYNNVEKAGEEIAAAFAGNAHGPFFLGLGAMAVGALLVHVSTDYVFDGAKASYAEDETPNPINAYGVSKFAGEMLVRALWEKSIIVRTSWLFGPSDASTRNFVTTMLLAAKNNGEIRVVSDQVGCPTYAPDLADAIKGLCERQAPAGIYHIANAGACSRYEFAKEIFRCAKRTASVTSIATAESGTGVRRPPSSILRNTKLPMLRSWQDALQEYVQSMI